MKTYHVIPNQATPSIFGSVYSAYPCAALISLRMGLMQRQPHPSLFYLSHISFIFFILLVLDNVWGVSVSPSIQTECLASEYVLLFVHLRDLPFCFFFFSCYLFIIIYHNILLFTCLFLLFMLTICTRGDISHSNIELNLYLG